MAGLFGFESLGGNPEEINKTYGVPQGIVNNANSDSMIGLGGLLMAAGQRQTPQQRAQMLSQLGNAVSAGDRSLYTGAQSYLMSKKYQDEAGMADLKKRLIQHQINKGQGHWASESELPPGYDGKNPIWMGEDGPKAVGSGGTTINNVSNPIVKGVGEQFSDSIGNAKSAANTINSLNAAREQLDMPGGITSGLGAEARLDFKKAATLFGADASQVTNTESFRAAIKPIVLSNVKALGAGNAISNADKDFVNDAVGGNLNLDEPSIRRILDITERGARYTIENHNKTAQKMLKTTPGLGEMAPLITVDMPEPYQKKQSDPLAAARQAIQAGADRQQVVNRLLKAGINPKGL
jgi:hypothetical protein